LGARFLPNPVINNVVFSDGLAVGMFSVGNPGSDEILNIVMSVGTDVTGSTSVTDEPGTTE